MSEHEVIVINDFKVILNHSKMAKTTMVESYVSNGFINEHFENAGISHLLEHVVTEGGINVVNMDALITGKKKVY